MPNFPSDPSMSRQPQQPDRQRGGGYDGGMLPTRPRPSRMSSKPTTTGQPMYADGGPVGDPMGGSPVETAMAYGRRKMGLPVDFEKGNVASFDDGGMVPDPSAAPQQAEPPNPENIMKYLAGDGALSPDVIMAMEAMADPDNTMDPSERIHSVLGRAPSPDVQFGIMQHHRTKYNGYTAAARVAAEKGDYHKAAMYANKAHDSVPGNKRKFAPGMGGIQMTNGEPEQSQEGFSDGGTVDSSNPENASDEESYADGGQVPYRAGDSDYPDLPESDNGIEDRRVTSGPRSYGVVAKNDPGQDIDRPSSLAGKPKPAPDDERISREEMRTASRPVGTGFARQDAGFHDYANANVKYKPSKFEQGFDDGGEVEPDEPDDDGDDMTTDAPQPTVTAAVTTPEDDELTTGGTPAPTASAVMDPMSLSPEDFNRMMGVPYDTRIKQAPSADPIMHEGQSIGNKIWNMMPGKPSPYKPQYGDTQQDDGSQYPDDAAPPAASPAGGKRPDQRPQNESEHAEKANDPYKKQHADSNARRDEHMQWLEDQSRKLFPWASQEGQRQNFIAGGMDRFFNRDLSRENSIRADHAGTAERKQRADSENKRMVEDRKDARFEGSQHTKQVIAAAHESGLAARMAAGEFGKYIRTAQQTSPDALSDPAVLKNVQRMLAAQNIRLQEGQEQAAVNLIMGNRPPQSAPGKGAPMEQAGAGGGMGPAPGQNHVSELLANRGNPRARAAFEKMYPGWSKRILGE